MPMTIAKHEESLHQPALCELLPVRDFLDGVSVRRSGALVAGYELTDSTASTTTTRAEPRRSRSGGVGPLAAGTVDAHADALRDHRRHRRRSNGLSTTEPQRECRAAGNGPCTNGAVGPERGKRLLPAAPAACLLHLEPANSPRVGRKSSKANGRGGSACQSKSASSESGGNTKTFSPSSAPARRRRADAGCYGHGRSADER